MFHDDLRHKTPLLLYLKPYDISFKNQIHFIYRKNVVKKVRKGINQTLFLFKATSGVTNSPARATKAFLQSTKWHNVATRFQTHGAF
jgi:hypothetical protein